MHTKKIAIVTDAWHPQINGVVTTLSQTVSHLKKLGFKVKTITPRQFKTVPCPTYPEISLSLAGPKKIKKKLKKLAPDAIHIATEGPLGWAARRACLSMKIPFTTSYHTRFPEYVRMRFPVPLALSYSVIRKFHNSAERVFVATSQLKKELDRRGFRQVCLWSRGVDTDLFKPRKERLLDDVRPVFTYVGRVSPEKNIEAFLKLDLPGKKCIIGDGPSLQELRQKYPDTIFTGYKKGEELARLVASSTVFVFPSHTDTFGVVQLEAMACGLPVAAFPVDGPKAVIRNGVNGWMDQDLQTAALKCLELSPENCRRFAMDFSWEKCTNQFLDNLVFH